MPVLIKPVIGIQLVDVLYRLIQAKNEKFANSESECDAREPTSSKMNLRVSERDLASPKHQTRRTRHGES